MTKDELLTRVKQQLSLCAGFEGDAVAKAREQALDYYFQRARGDEVPGRSQVVSGDLSAMVEANLAQMLDAFSSPRVAEFEANGPEDENQAQLESDTVQYFVMKKSNGFLELAQSIKDALLLRNGLVKVWVEEREQTETKSYTGVTVEGLAEATNKPGTQIKVEHFDPDTGEATLKTTRTVRAFKAKALPPENFLYPKDWDRLDLTDVPFCAERHIDKRSDLIELFPKAKAKILELSGQRVTYKSDGAARNPASVDSSVQGKKPIDASQDDIEWYECYALVDVDGDGISERRKICLTQETLLIDEPASVVPYGAGTAIINPHRFTGISLFDKLKQTQDITTGLERALMDNVNTVTKNRLAYLDGKVNNEDVSDGRPNGAIRVKANVPDIRTAVMPFTVPDQSVGILQGIEYQKSKRGEMGGAALDMQTAQMQIGGDRMGSQGLDRAYSVVEQLCALMTRLIAQSLIRSIFLIAHATLRENYSEPVPIKRNGKWLSPIPSKWPARECVEVKIGMSAGERSRKASSLAFVLDKQMQLAGAGMDEVLVNLDGFYALLMDWMRVSDIQNPERYFRDPQSPEAKQAIQSKQAAQAEQTKMQQALMQQAIGLEQLKIGLQKWQTDIETQFKYYDAVLGAEVEEAKIVGKATTDLLAAKNKGKDKANAKPETVGATAEDEPAAE